MKKDLKKMSRKELEKLMEDVKKALTNVKGRERAQARKAAEKAAAAFGFSLGDLTDGDTPKRGRPKGKKTAPKQGAPKYRNPEDAAQTWTGKGRKPNWFIREMNKGTAPETLAV